MTNSYAIKVKPTITIPFLSFFALNLAKTLENVTALDFSVKIEKKFCSKV